MADYNRWGVHPDGTRDPHAPIAPFGPIRAQLNFDPSTQRLDLYVKDRFTETPVSVPARKLNLLISRGYSEIGIPLDGRRRFQFRLPFLGHCAISEKPPTFSARVALPVGSIHEDGIFRSLGFRFDQPCPAQRSREISMPHARWHHLGRSRRLPHLRHDPDAHPADAADLPSPARLRHAAGCSEPHRRQTRASHASRPSTTAGSFATCWSSTNIRCT